VGRHGVTPELLRAVDEALESRELIKVRFVDFKGEKKELIREIAERTSSEAVGLIGNVAILYRRQPDEKKRKISFTS